MSRLEENATGRALNCSKAGLLLPFYACDELGPQEREQIAAHIALCAQCAAQLENERLLLDAVSAMPQPADRLDPADTLLSQCRSELAETLDDLTTPPERARWQSFGWFRRFMVFRPAWSAALLILFGVVVGTQTSLFRTGGNVQEPGHIVRATQPLTEEQLSKMSVAGINIAPSPDDTAGTVRVQLRAEQPLILSGSIEDTGVRHLLTYVVENGQRFDAGVRLDCLDALKSVTSDADVRRAFLAAARRDENPAVRLKALDALRDSADEGDVRETLLNALEHDANPGVRVEAVNLLVGSLQEQQDVLAKLGSPAPQAIPPTNASAMDVPTLVDPSAERVLRALQDLMRRDPNHYVRLRSAAALRQLGPRETQ
jgi:hypothetical protein